MKIVNVIAVTASIVAGGVGCSSGAVDQGGTRTPPGVARLTVDDQEAGRFEAVQCIPTKNTTAITIGTDPGVVVVAVSSADGLGLDWIRFNDANGFTGGYNDGLNGTAKVAMKGATYEISGTATGFHTRDPSRPATATFSMEISC